jgi:hypothetical protein
MVDMDIASYYALLVDLSWVLSTAVIVLGVVYVLISKPEDKKP